MRRLLDKIIKAVLDFAVWLGKMKDDRATDARGAETADSADAADPPFKWDIVASGGGYVVRFKDSRGTWLDLYQVDTLEHAEILYERISGRKWRK